MKGGDLLINRFSFDVQTGRFPNRRIVIRNGIRKDKPFSIRQFNATEIRHALNRAGLDDHRLLDENSQPLSANSRRMVVIARKPLQVRGLVIKWYAAQHAHASDRPACSTLPGRA